MKKVLFIFLLVISSMPALAQKDKEQIEASVIGFFNGLSLIDADTLGYYTTSDFQLLENGEVWNLDTLIHKVMPRKNAGITRVNKFEFIKTEQNGTMGWVSYNNSAELSKGDKKQTIRWLESAVLIKQKGRWKIRMLHSTKLK
jgi:hypothetical protein